MSFSLMQTESLKKFTYYKQTQLLLFRESIFAFKLARTQKTHKSLWSTPLLSGSRSLKAWTIVSSGSVPDEKKPFKLKIICIVYTFWYIAFVPMRLTKGEKQQQKNIWSQGFLENCVLKIHKLCLASISAAKLWLLSSNSRPRAQKSAGNNMCSHMSSVSQTFLFHRVLFTLDTSFSPRKLDKANTG